MFIEALLCYLLYKRIKLVQLNNHKEIRKSMRSYTKKKRWEDMKKMLSDERIKFYLKRLQGKDKKSKLKAKSIFLKDMKRYGQARINKCKRMIKELFK